MNEQPPQRRGGCPGARRPMITGDGLLVRLRIIGGRLEIQTARALADLARRFGNGLFDLSSRGNLQLRGLADANMTALHTELDALELLDANEGTEPIRNILASPLAGLDPTVCMDVSSCVDRLDEALAKAEDLHALPAKYGFVVDGGGRLPLHGIEADVRFIALTPETFCMEANGITLGVLPAASLIESALAVSRAFLHLRFDDERRLRNVMRRLGPQPLIKALSSVTGARCNNFGTDIIKHEHDPSTVALWKEGKEQPNVHALAGFSAFSQSDKNLETGFFAAAAPFGRLTAGQLAGLATLAEELQCSLRLSPWRAIVLAPIQAEQALLIAHRIGSLGLIVDQSDPLLSMTTCPGKPACLSGQAPTHTDARLFARSLAPLLDGSVSVHVSGCSKGCARRQPATITLVAKDGRYGLAFGAKASAPSITPLLTPQAMADHLATIDRLSLAATRTERAAHVFP